MKAKNNTHAKILALRVRALEKEIHRLEREAAAAREELTNTKRELVDMVLKDKPKPAKGRSCKGACVGCNSVPCHEEFCHVAVHHNLETNMTEVWFSRKPTRTEGEKIFPRLKAMGFGWNGKAWIKKYDYEDHRAAVWRFEGDI